MAYKPSKNEKVLRVYPIGIRYTCEFCKTGEVRYDPSKQQPMDMIPGAVPNLFPHVCQNPDCGKISMLPKIYPCIEWEDGEEIKYPQTEEEPAEVDPAETESPTEEDVE